MIRWIKHYLKENRIVWYLIVFGIFYLCSFFILEHRNVPIHIIHSPLDDKIPFCEYFIIPYFFWFIYVIGTICYFAFMCDQRVERDRMIHSLCFGMVVFLIVSWIYPNGHQLRPVLEGEGIFVGLVKLLYTLDTSTNILPSLHVYETVVCSIALLRQKKLCSKKWFAPAIWFCSIMIILSTMFLKQHSVVDVFSALVLNVICYFTFYKSKKIRKV